MPNTASYTIIINTKDLPSSIDQAIADALAGL